MIVDELSQALELKETNPEKCGSILAALVKRDGESSDEEFVKTKETAILELGELLAKTKQAQELEGEQDRRKIEELTPSLCHEMQMQRQSFRL